MAVELKVCFVGVLGCLACLFDGLCAVINKDSRQAWVLELELLDADVPFVPLRCLPPVIIDSIALATLQVVRVELLLCKHALMDEMRHGTIAPPKAPEPEEDEEPVSVHSSRTPMSLVLAFALLKCILLLKWDRR